MFGKKKIEVNAVLDTQIENLLKRTSQYEDLINGIIKCESCACTITSQNIGIMQPIENGTKILFYCERIDCAEEYKQSNKF